MEIIIAIVVIAGLGYWVYRSNQPKSSVIETAPYKVEAPAQESTPVAEPAKEVTSVTASKPARALKAPAAVKKKTVAPAKQPAAKKAVPKKAAPKKVVKVVAKK